MRYQTFDPILKADEADRIKQIARAFGPHGIYAQAPHDGFGAGIPQRYDGLLDFLSVHKDAPLAEMDLGQLQSRTMYFRETYAYGDDVRAPGIEPFLYNEPMIEAARAIFNRPVIEPAIVFSNIMLPGQGLHTHTDVPEFRGANRKELPEWLLVAMHHSGLFEDWRMPIATCVSWYHSPAGGQFVFYPDGAGGEAIVHDIAHNTAVIMDTDTLFHAVAPIAEAQTPLPTLSLDMKIHPVSDDEWEVRDGDQVLATYGWDAMRLSVSWKAYCFASEDERDAWRTNADDLTLDFILDRLFTEMRKRGVMGDEPPSEGLAELIIGTFIHYPPGHPVISPLAFEQAA